MKNFALMAVTGFMLIAPGLAWAEGASSNVKRVGQASSFAENKAEMLRRLNDQLADAEESINCVQAADSHEALRACAEQRAAKQGQQGKWGGGVSPVGNAQGSGG